MFVSEDQPFGRAARIARAASKGRELGYGRFLQADPLGYADGLNQYNYVHSDPVNATDPSGQDDESQDIVVTARRVRQDGGGGGFSIPWGGPTQYFGGFGNGGGGGGNANDVVVVGKRPKPAPAPPTTPDIVVTGVRPQQIAFHVYRIKLLSPCRAGQVFGYFKMAGHSAPFAPATQEGTRNIMLPGGNPISQYVNSADMTIVNTTLPGHVFYPGTVTINVSPLGTQTSQISITGTGNGNDAEANDIIGNGFFGGQAAGAQTVCM